MAPGAPRWTEAPKAAGPLEPWNRPPGWARALPWDPGGGWETDDGGNEATSWAVNLAVPRTRVIWGSTEDFGPGGSGRMNTPRDPHFPSRARLAGQFFEGERILIPVPDEGGTFDVQTWGAFAGTSGGGAAGGDPIWEWGRVNFNNEAAIVSITVPPLGSPPPPPPPPPTVDVEGAKKVLREGFARLRTEGAGWPAIKLTEWWRAYKALGGR